MKSVKVKVGKKKQNIITTIGIIGIILAIIGIILLLYKIIKTL